MQNALPIVGRRQFESLGYRRLVRSQVFLSGYSDKEIHLASWFRVNEQNRLLTTIALRGQENSVDCFFNSL